ncbi:MAG: hypothetical protein LRY62_01380 [Alphaproteobacteria bacterium]|nr:hypothetical protein [Alphaproteobacteria bacterium]
MTTLISILLAAQNSLLYMLEILKNLSPYIADWATFGAVIAALLTLREMHRQRKHSYKPDIVPVKQVFSGYFQSPVFCDWVINDSKYEEDVELKSSDLEISLFNLGNGAAKDIHLTWDFDLDPFVKKLNLLNKENKTGIGIEKLDSFLEFKDNDESVAMVNVRPNLEKHEDYLLPASIEQNGLKVSIPSAYTWLVSNYFYIRFKVLSKDLDPSIPSLKLKIEYSDIANNRYKTVFEFDVGLIFFANNDPMPDFRAYLNYKLAN